jgi:23S rRNA (guanosine2251-2'-O)-methyltransferase
MPKPSRLRKLRRPTDSKPEEEQEIIYGRQTLLAALRSGATLNRVWVVPRLRYSPQFLSLLEEAKARGTVIDEVSPQRLNLLTGGANHQGSPPRLPLIDTWI